MEASAVLRCPRLRKPMRARDGHTSDTNPSCHVQQNINGYWRVLFSLSTEWSERNARANKQVIHILLADWTQVLAPRPARVGIVAGNAPRKMAAARTAWWEFTHHRLRTIIIKISPGLDRPDCCHDGFGAENSEILNEQQWWQTDRTFWQFDLNPVYLLRNRKRGAVKISDLHRVAIYAISTVLEEQGKSTIQCEIRIYCLNVCVNIKDVQTSAHYCQYNPLYAGLINQDGQEGSELLNDVEFLHADDMRRLQSFTWERQRQILGVKWSDHLKNIDITVTTAWFSKHRWDHL